MKALAVHMLQLIDISQGQDGDVGVRSQHCKDGIPVLDREYVLYQHHGRKAHNDTWTVSPSPILPW